MAAPLLLQGRTVRVSTSRSGRLGCCSSSSLPRPFSRYRRWLAPAAFLRPRTGSFPGRFAPRPFLDQELVLGRLHPIQPSAKSTPDRTEPMTELEQDLVGRIRQSGPITFHDFMAAALYDPRH